MKLFLQSTMLQRPRALKDTRTSDFFVPVRAQKRWSGFPGISFDLSPVPWQFLSSSPILQSSWPSQSHLREMQRWLWHWNWSSAQRSSQPLCTQTQLKHNINRDDYGNINHRKVFAFISHFHWNNWYSPLPFLKLFSRTDPGIWHGGDTKYRTNKGFMALHWNYS